METTIPKFGSLKSTDVSPIFAVGIIGAGFAGIIAALNLKRTGRDNFIIFERATSIGGTWRDNIYPGCACDVPSYVYSISEVPNPDWSRMYSPQPEILTYMKNVVNSYGLEAHIRYDADIVYAKFVESEGIWNVVDRQGRATKLKAIVAALGPLNRAKMPNIAGIERFQGTSFHTSQWDTTFDPIGKSVAIIGTGASAIQVVPAIAPIAAQLTLFQRTAAWISPRNDHAITDFRKRIFRRFPKMQRLLRNIIYSVMEIRGHLFIGNKFLQRILTRQSLKKLAEEVQDPETRRKLTPDYKLGCKRILSSDDYLPTFNRENVTLVTEAISEITTNGIRTSNGDEIIVDAIIFATGFEAAELKSDTKIIGRNGRELFSEWEKTGMEAHHGTTFSGYPNLTYLLGPNTGLGHSSVLHIMESQMPYILQYLDLLDQLGPQGFLDVNPEAQASYNAKIQSEFKGTVWESGCKSWYLNSKGKNTTLFPRLTREFRRRMTKLDRESYTISNEKVASH